MITKVTVESTLNSEFDEHLGYSKNKPSIQGNYRNGHAPKTIKTEDGAIKIGTPRDRNTFFSLNLSIKIKHNFIFTLIFCC